MNTNYYYIISYFLFYFIGITYSTDVQFYQIINNVKQNINVDKLCTTKSPCLPKCCALGQVLTRKGKRAGCRDDNILKFSDIRINIYDSKNNKTISDSPIMDKFSIIHSEWFLDESEGSAFTNYWNYTHDVLYDNGEVLTKALPALPVWRLGQLDFCLDFKKGKLAIKIKQLPRSDDSVASVIMNTAMLVSCLVLLINLVIYCILPDITIVEIMRAAYVASMMVAYCFKASIQLALLDNNITSQQIRFLAIIAHFAILSSFNWLTVMCLDTWWSVRGNRKHRKIHRRGIIHKFIMYCLFGFGIPALMVIACIVIDLLKVQFQQPLYEDFFSASSFDSLKYYIHIPLLLYTIVNSALFMMTVYNIWKIKRALANFSPSETRSTLDNQKRFITYLKLFLIMGVSWLFNFLQSIVEFPYIVIKVLDMFYSLIGILIFYLFICYKSMYQRIAKRLGINRDLQKRTDTTSTTGSKNSKLRRQKDIEASEITEQFEHN